MDVDDALRLFHPCRKMDDVERRNLAAQNDGQVLERTVDFHVGAGNIELRIDEVLVGCDEQPIFVFVLIVVRLEQIAQLVQPIRGKGKQILRRFSGAGAFGLSAKCGGG